ncbi:hypothetical protein MHH56_25375 [Paenibacillus sp. FSL K6-3182]|uniref:hypothetical protein n=1 Tax=Paenibacillus sp. FSL K6-3182 TaxID=2921495 RepID=UPI0030D3080C
MKRGYIILIGVVVVAAAILMFLFRVNENQVTVQRMLDFEQAEPTSQVVWEDRESIRAFEYAFRFGKQMKGKVDIAAPPYSVILGDSRYLLWISKSSEHGNFMKPGDTGTLYRLGKSSTKKIWTLLEDAYSVSGSGKEGADEQVDGEQQITQSMSPSPIIESSTPIPMQSSESPNNEVLEPAYLESSAFTEEEKPLIELINLRIKYLHEKKWDDFLNLYTDSARKSREGSSGITGFTITSIKVEQPIAIKEQKSLFEAVVQVSEIRNNEDSSGSSVYVFHKSKEKGAEWRIADVD